MSGKRGRKCSMKNCDSYQHTHKHLSFFRFPKDMERYVESLLSKNKPNSIVQIVPYVLYPPERNAYVASSYAHIHSVFICILYASIRTFNPSMCN